MKPLYQYIMESSSNIAENFTIEVHKAEDEDWEDYLSTNTDSFWQLLQDAYANKGGFRGLQSKKDLKKKITLIKTALYKGQLVALSIYNKYIPVYKCVGIGAVIGELHKQSVVGVKLILRHDVENWDDYVYIEADLEVEKICKEVGAFNLPAEYAYELFKGNIMLCDDGFHYTRFMPAINKTIYKTIFGIPNERIFRRVSAEHDALFNEFINSMESKIVKIDYTRFNESKAYEMYSPIEIARWIIYAFYDRFQDFGKFEYSKELIQRLKDNIEKVKQLYSEGQYDKNYGFLYPVAIEDGEEVLSKLREFDIENIIIKFGTNE